MKIDKLIIDFECEQCGQKTSLEEDEIGTGNVLMCNWCKHPHIWQECKFCGSGHYYTEYFIEGECINCASILEPIPINQVGLLRKLMSRNCPYCRYPINPIKVVLPPEQIQCPSCKHISVSSAQRGTIISVVIFLFFVIIFEHETDFYNLLPEYLNFIVFFTTFIGGILIFLSKCYDLNKTDNH